MWLHRARDGGIEVLVGDPGRRYLPTHEPVELCSYDVRPTTELEDLERKQGRAYALRPWSADMIRRWSGRSGTPG